MAALLGGNVDVIATDASAVGEYVKAGKVRVLAVTAPKRLDGVLKDVPTLMELGIGTEFTIWRGVFGPKNMSDSAVAFWDKTFKTLSQSEAWKKELQANGWLPEYRSASEFRKFLESQEQVIHKLLSSIGMAKE